MQHFASPKHIDEGMDRWSSQTESNANDMASESPQCYDAAAEVEGVLDAEADEYDMQP